MILQYIDSQKVMSNTTLPEVPGKVYRITNGSSTSVTITFGANTSSLGAGITCDFWYDGANWLFQNAGVTTTLPASGISVVTTGFGGILTSAEDTTQKCMDKIDDHNHPIYQPKLTLTTIHGTYTYNDIYDLVIGQFGTGTWKVMVSGGNGGGYGASSYSYMEHISGNNFFTIYGAYNTGLYSIAITDGNLGTIGMSLAWYSPLI